MRNNLFLILFLAFSTVISAQNKELVCLDFNKGEFRNSSDITNISSIIIRNGEKQLEITNGEKSYKIVKWYNDCDYALFYSTKEARKDPFKKFINKGGGISVTKVKIEGTTLYYKTSYFDGKKQIIADGKMIKISSNASFN